MDSFSRQYKPTVNPNDNEAQKAVRERFVSLWGSVRARNGKERVAFVREIARNYDVDPLWLYCMARDEMRIMLGIRTRAKKIAAE